MWQVIELAEGSPQTDALLAQVAGVTIDRDALLWLVETAAARGVARPGQSTHELELGPEGRHRRTPLKTGTAGRRAAPGEMYVDENGQPIWNLERPNIQIRSRGVHHDRSAMIASPRGGTVAEVSYDPELKTARSMITRAVVGRPEPYSQARIWPRTPADRILDGRLYLGADTTIAEGQTDSNGSGAGCARGCQSRTWPEARSGRSSERYSGSTAPQPESWTGSLGCDASHTGRSISRQSLLNTLRLDAAAAIKGDPDVVTVVVHGTMSCRLPGLLTLHDAGCITEPMLRYEHDTFTGIAVNATELAGLIRQRFSYLGRPRSG